MEQTPVLLSNIPEVVAALVTAVLPLFSEVGAAIIGAIAGVGAGLAFVHGWRGGL